MTIVRAFRRRVCFTSAIVLAAISTQAAQAEDGAVAIVEDTSGNVAGVEPLDLLREGKTIALQTDAGIIISYLNSCQRENIRGGMVTIGKSQSAIAGGTVARAKLACDPVALALTPEQANQSATLVFRKPDKISGDPVAAQAKFVMDTRQPLVIVPNLAEITIEDLRHVGTKWSVKVVRGVADLTADRKALEQGGVYRLVGGGRALIFRIGKEATDAPLPLLKRVIRF